MKQRSLTYVCASLLIAILTVGCGDSGSSDNDNDNGNNTSSAKCGDGEIGGVEECDDGAQNSDSRPDACRTDCSRARCGDEVVDSDEECDDGARNSNTQPDACRLGCVAPSCGDGIIDTGRGEQCDDGNTAPGDGCGPTCLNEVCGDGIVGPNEACDDGNTVSGDGCSESCNSDETCGNGVVDAVRGEECDEGAGNSDAPNAACRPDCRYRRCGDGILDDQQGETCDGTRLGGATCQSEGFYFGTVACTGQCQLDLSDCEGRCGDGVADVGHEDCDTDDLDQTGCTDLGYYQGNLTCNGDCTFNEVGCSEFCGDGVVNGPELCDQSDFSGDTCAARGYYGGTLTCNADCDEVTTGSCTEYCGDGIANGTEECDGLDQGGQDCTDHGYAAGRLGCDASCQQDFSRCLDKLPDWYLLASGGGETFNAVWGSSPDDVFVVGESGVIRHYDGVNVTPMSSGVSAHLQAVWGSSGTNVYAVGDNGTIRRYQGSGWEYVSCMCAPGCDLSDIWGSAADNIYAVGTELFYGPPLESTGFIQKSTGGSFVADRTVSNRHYSSVWGAGSSDVHVVGWQGTLLGQCAFLQLSNYSWSEQLGVAGGLRQVHGNSDTNFYAIGSDSSSTPLTHNLLVHYDGSTWQSDTAPPAGYLIDLWVGGSEGMFALGAADQNGDQLDVFYRPASGSWSALGAPFSPKSDSSGGLWGFDAEDLFIVAGDEILRYHPVPRWSPLDSDTAETLHGLWSSDAGTAYAVGDGGEAVRWDGAAWATDPTGFSLDLYAVHGLSDDLVFAVGAGGLLLQRASGVWGNITSGTGSDALYGVWAAASDDIVAVGEGGLAVRSDGNLTGPESTGTTADLHAVWGAASDDVFAVGDGGTILHHDGSGWSAMVSTTTARLRGLWGTGPDDVYAVGDGGVILRYDGLSWSAMASGATGDLYAVWGSRSDDVYAAGAGGILLHNDGTGWAAAGTAASTTVRALAGTSATNVFAAGDTGRMARFTAGFPGPDGGTCVAPVDLYCEAAVVGSNRGRQTAVSDYVACGGRVDDGPEVPYRFVAPFTGQATATLTAGSGDLDLNLVGAHGDGTCDPGGQCLAASALAGPAPESLTFALVAGETYYLMVDGFSGAESGYRLDLSCDMP